MIDNPPKPARTPWRNRSAKPLAELTKPQAVEARLNRDFVRVDLIQTHKRLGAIAWALYVAMGYDEHIDQGALRRGRWHGTADLIRLIKRQTKREVSPSTARRARDLMLEYGLVDIDQTARDPMQRQRRFYVFALDWAQSQAMLPAWESRYRQTWAPVDADAEPEPDRSGPPNVTGLEVEQADRIPPERAREIFAASPFGTAATQRGGQR